MEIILVVDSKSTSVNLMALNIGRYKSNQELGK